MQLPLVLLGLTVVSSGLGAGTYLLLRRDKPSKFLLVTQVLLPFLASLLMGAAGGPLLFVGFMVPVGLVCLISMAGAWAHRQLAGYEQMSKKESILLIATATMLSIWLSIGGLVLMTDPIRAAFADSDPYGSSDTADWLLTVYVVIHALAPTVTTGLLWWWQNKNKKHSLSASETA